jgi:hypothetical protein
MVGRAADIGPRISRRVGRHPPIQSYSTSNPAPQRFYRYPRTIHESRQRARRRAAICPLLRHELGSNCAAQATRTPRQSRPNDFGPNRVPTVSPYPSREHPMLRAHCRFRRVMLPVVLLAAVGAGTQPARAQVVVFDSNGFESPTFSNGAISGQQGFQFLPSSAAGVVQNGTVFGGSQAFEIVGSQLQENDTYGQANFWYKSYSFAAATNPVASGNPLLHVSFAGRVSGALALPSDIPFGGPYLEGYTSAGIQQAITPFLINTNGGITVFTNSVAGGSNETISTADGLIPRESWHTLEGQLNFSTQTFRVLLDGSPVTFSLGTFSGFDVPFRDSFGTTVSIAELGFQGYWNSAFSPTFNNMFFDNLSYVATPVPEPSTLALGGFALGGLALRMRSRRAGR